MYKSILASVLSLSLLVGPFSYGAVEVYADPLRGQPQDVQAGQTPPLIPNDQLDSLVAPDRALS